MSEHKSSTTQAIEEKKIFSLNVQKWPTKIKFLHKLSATNIVDSVNRLIGLMALVIVSHYVTDKKVTSVVWTHKNWGKVSTIISKEASQVMWK